MEIPSYVICCSFLVAFNILSWYFNFVNLINLCLGMILPGFILYRTLHFLDLGDCFLSHVMEVLSYYLFKILLRPFLSPSSPSGTPYNENVQFSSVQLLSRIQLFATP